MRVVWQIAVTLTLAALLGAGWWQWSVNQDSAKSREPKRASGAATLVLVEPAQPAEDSVLVQAIGTGEARRSVTIHAAAAGEVVEIGFEADRRVARNAVLLRLDDTHQRLAVRLAEVAVREAKRNLERLEELASKGAASQARLETAQHDLESAALRVDQAKAALDDRTVTAPFAGVVGLTDVDVGDRITVDTPIAILDDRAFLKVAFDVPEEFAGRMRVGQVVTVRPRSLSAQDIQGVISATGSRIDRLTRSLRVEAEIPNADDSLRPGTSFEVRFSFTGNTYPAIREVAVLWSRDGAYVWRVTDEKAEKVFVRIVRRDNGRILLDGPLRIGDSVVVEGVQGLREGQRVEPRPFGGNKISAVPMTVAVTPSEEAS